MTPRYGGGRFRFFGSDFRHGHPPYNCAVSIVEANDGKLPLVADDCIYYDPADCVDRSR